MFGAFYFAQSYFADFPVFGATPPTPPTPTGTATTSPIYGAGAGTGVFTSNPHYEIDFGRRKPGGVRKIIWASARLRISIGLFARHSTKTDSTDDDDLVSIISAFLDDE